VNDRDLALAARIQLAQADSFLTKAEFAHAAGITPDKLSKVLSGKRRVSSLELALMSQASGWPVERLLGIQIDVTGYRAGYIDGWKAALQEVRTVSMGTVSVADLIDKGSETFRCHVPPDGWACTRDVGHDGPCAAVPTHSTESFAERLARESIEASRDQIANPDLWSQPTHEFGSTT
jgi:hypothetical protein